MKKLKEGDLMSLSLKEKRPKNHPELKKSPRKTC